MACFTFPSIESVRSNKRFSPVWPRVGAIQHSLSSAGLPSDKSQNREKLLNKKLTRKFPMGRMYSLVLDSLQSSWDTRHLSIKRQFHCIGLQWGTNPKLYLSLIWECLFDWSWSWQLIILQSSLYGRLCEVERHISDSHLPMSVRPWMLVRRTCFSQKNWILIFSDAIASLAPTPVSPVPQFGT